MEKKKRVGRKVLWLETMPHVLILRQFKRKIHSNHICGRLEPKRREERERKKIEGGEKEGGFALPWVLPRETTEEHQSVRCFSRYFP